jgi:long-chain acyl-CoA synthetase
LNGGGPISTETQRFISFAITPMISGYGLTETAACGAIQDPLSWTTESLGELPGSVECKLVDFPDAGYFATNNPPQGEIWLRGPSVVSGYLDLESETKEAFTDDGWFKTGDIGEFDHHGQTRIIDRKKNLVKTLNGEYIALEKLESIYRSATVVANICVYADPHKAKPVAIIVPAEPALKKIAGDLGVAGDHLEELVHDEKVNDAVLKQLQDVGRKGGLGGIEIIEGVILADEEWTPQNVSSKVGGDAEILLTFFPGPHHISTKAQPKSYLGKVQEGGGSRVQEGWQLIFWRLIKDRSRPLLCPNLVRYMINLL